MKDKFYQYILQLQNQITSKLEEVDGVAKFREDIWTRPEGGGGKTRVIENGKVFEKGGVNISAVHGKLPESMQKLFNVGEADFFACGLSLVIHPNSPMVPTVHANWRYFEMYDTSTALSTGSRKVINSWFGGGQDLTPYYLFEEDSTHFHQTCKTACDKHNLEFYPKFKKQCDTYFWNAHRNEARGIGGLFFDYCKESEEMKMEDWFNFVTEVGNSFLEAYVPIVEKEKNLSFTEAQKTWQEIRRGRYVEFNLVHDKGTLFGLKTNGRIESILMSLPPHVQWVYDHHPVENSEEEKLIKILMNPVDWVLSVKVKTTLKLKLLNNFKQYYMFPLRRNRRLRTNESIRSLVRETIISPNDFIVPLFVVEGKNVRDEIPSMQNYFRLSLDNLEKEVKELWNLGLKSVLLFVKVPDNLKDNAGKEALNPDGLMQRAIKNRENVCPHMIVMTDVALDPYSVYGHDGIIENGQIENDKTSLFLAEMSVSHAKAGADIVAPSDMMDGRILEIREALEDEGLINTGILAYSAKYASAHYGPFRDALDSAPKDNSSDTELVEVPKDKKTYQMDYHNRLEAIRETRMDIEEGADIVMVKPGIAYLDIVREVKNMSEVPVAVYQVSGEYAMIKAAAEKGWIDHDAVMMEQVTAIKRAGADLIASYFAKDVVKLIS